MELMFKPLGSIINHLIVILSNELMSLRTLNYQINISVGQVGNGPLWRGSTQTNLELAKNRISWHKALMVHGLGKNIERMKKHLINGCKANIENRIRIL